MAICMFDNINTLLFDLDGTLIDSMWMWKTIDIDFLNKYGISMPPKLQEDIEGKSFNETAVYFKETFDIPDSLEAIKNCWNDMANELYKNKVMLKQGALKFLETAKEHGFKIGIATSNSRELTATVVNSLKIESFIDSITTGCDVKAGKPSPDIYLKACATLNSKPLECLAFEDIPMGILSAKNAKMKVCAVYDIYSIKYDNTKKTMADYYIDSFDAIRNEIPYVK